MRRKDRINFAKFLISLSFVLITTGLAIDIEKKQIYNPVEKTYVISSSDSSGTISITTITEDDPKTSADNNTSQSESNNNQSNNNNTLPPTNALTIEDANNNLRSRIQTQYGINIKYGDETTGYSVGGLQTNSIIDTNMINQELNNLNFNMSLYPTNFFKEIKDYGYPLTIYLVKNYSQTNVTGITDSINNNVIISIASDYSFSESFHHEIYHYIEKYIYVKGGRYTTWNNFNPSGFQYGKVNKSLSYSTTKNEFSYFVNNYAQTDAAEDRASTFEYMTLNNKEACFNGQTPIKLKAKAISEQIDAVFTSVSSNTKEYWERYIY